MAETVCGPRVAELSEQRSELVKRQQELARQVKASAPSLPTADDLVAVANQLRQAIAQGSPEVVKQFLGELIDRIEIGSDKQAQPYFWVPRLQAPDRAKRGHSRTPVRIQSNHVEPIGLEPTTSCLQSRRSTN